MFKGSAVEHQVEATRKRLRNFSSIQIMNDVRLFVRACVQSEQPIKSQPRNELYVRKDIFVVASITPGPSGKPRFTRQTRTGPGRNRSQLPTQRQNLARPRARNTLFH